MYTILVIGGSIPAAQGVRRGYVEILAKGLKGRGLVIINRAGKGATSFDGVNNLREELEKWKPWKLLIHYGVDDMYRPVYRSEFKENLVQMCRRARESGVRAVLSTSQPFLEQVEKQAGDIYNRTIREVAVELGCDYIPVHLKWASELITNNIEPGSLLQRDSRLPNAEGHRLLARIMEYHLMKHLRNEGSLWE